MCLTIENAPKSQSFYRTIKSTANKSFSGQMYYLYNEYGFL
ncbi:hypothetical protein AQPE_4524 [Aquipluma nitroreducens]|uniref:Uncharacterized protein n=1 Tax=Aquipluma nitroreducens TaxID=2010828 RepID=A0A5K7SFK8_9BACT|nr:hypothetical protein AQPE_4524 [Aquipluma nitroreducens]